LRAKLSDGGEAAIQARIRDLVPGDRKSAAPSLVENILALFMRRTVRAIAKDLFNPANNGGCRISRAEIQIISFAELE
jgi:hypothetical protein